MYQQSFSMPHFDLLFNSIPQTFYCIGMNYLHWVNQTLEFFFIMSDPLSFQAFISFPWVCVNDRFWIYMSSYTIKKYSTKSILNFAYKTMLFFIRSIPHTIHTPSPEWSLQFFLLSEYAFINFYYNIFALNKDSIIFKNKTS